MNTTITASLEEFSIGQVVRVAKHPALVNHDDTYAGRVTRRATLDEYIRVNPAAAKPHNKEFLVGAHFYEVVVHSCV